MIIIPEIETVVILVPRTGSGTLRRAIAETYPKSMLIYRHMEADGVPGGYDRWPKVGVVRNPVHRLWSLYNFIKVTNLEDHCQAYVQELRESAELPFNDWIVKNKTVFTNPYDSSGNGRFFPKYTVRHSLPENCKSQFVYLRPDLGTEIYRYRDQLPKLEQRLGVKLDQWHNGTGTEACRLPDLSPAAHDHLLKFFAWDLRHW